MGTDLSTEAPDVFSSFLIQLSYLEHLFKVETNRIVSTNVVKQNVIG